jgi:hypothetical protein
MVKPIFLFSLPRSGSTLLQRILMSHADIASTPEPWLLLPLIYAIQKNGTLTEYSFANCYAALEDFIDKLPRKKNDYYDAIRDFSSRLYEKQCGKREKYFLDKTPRYYHIIEQISEIFPDAKFIFLFRNPVQIFSSVIATWGDNRLRRLYGSYYDLFEGPNLLARGYQKMKDRSCTIQYEQLVSEPEHHLRKVLRYLELDYDEGIVKNSEEQNIEGRMGDPTGIKEYSGITKNPLEKWKSVIDNPVRKWYLKRYIKQIDSDILETQGYDKTTILREIESLKINKCRNVPQDTIDLGYAFLVRKCKANIFFGRSTKWARNAHLS